AEDGIRDFHVTGVQTCALPILGGKAITVSRSTLQDCTWLMREHGSGTGEVTARWLSMLHIKPQRSIEIGSNEGMARGVASGLGVAMLPVAVVDDLLQLGRVVELRVSDMPGLSRPLDRLERKDRPASHAVQAFLDILSRPV